MKGKYINKTLALLLCLSLGTSNLSSVNVLAQSQSEEISQVKTESILDTNISEETLSATEPIESKNIDFENTESEIETKENIADESSSSESIITAETELEAENITEFPTKVEDATNYIIDIDAQILELSNVAQRSFENILLQKDLMALLYKTDSYSIKSHADYNSDTVADINIGHTLYITDVSISGNNIWYKVNFALDGTEYSGYIEDSYLAYSDEDWLNWKNEYLPPINELVSPYSTNQIMDNGSSSSDIDAFPASYRDNLKKLKTAHPNWIFVPMNTGLDFNTVISNEMGEKSLIQMTDNNVSKGWVGAASTTEKNWYLATKAAVEYHINPVNFLTESGIFQFEQLTYNKSYHTEAALQSFLSNTFMSGAIPDDESNRTYSNAFYSIGKSRQISPIHLASRVYQEQGKGTSPLISGTYPGYEGYYNYFNVGANGTPVDVLIRNGLERAKKEGWNTRYKSLEGGAKTIGNNYILKGQDTIYLQKFNVDGNYNKLYFHQYMANIQAPSSESVTTKKTYSNAGSLSSPFVFKIPVYKNMPGSNDKPEEKPEEIPEENPTDIPEDVYFSNVTFMSENYSTQLSSIKLQYGETISENKFPSLESSPSKIFAGWFTGQNGTGTLFTSTTPVYGETITLYPYFHTSASGFSVIPVGDQIYTGTAIKPTVHVYDNYSDTAPAVELIKGVDYTVSYKNNTEVNITDASTPTITVKGIGNYSGSQKVFFDILPKSMKDKNITVANLTAAAYTGNKIKSKPSVYANNVKLTLNTDYTLSYPSKENGAYKEAGTYPIVIQGIGNYTDSITVYERITRRNLLKNAIVEAIPAQKYDSSVIDKAVNKGIVPGKITVTYNGKLLKESTDNGATGDYTVKYLNNMSAGTATAVITAVNSSNYAGTKKVTYKIKGTSIKNATIENLITKTYTGNINDVYQNSVSLYVNGTRLHESTDNGVTGDYLVKYKSISKPGTATIIFTGVNGYTGTLEKNYKISKYNISNGNNSPDSNITITYATEDNVTAEKSISSLSQIMTPYLKDGSKPIIRLYYNNKPLTLGKDYTVTYTNNKKITTPTMPDKKLPVITVKGIGNFRGSITDNFTITDGAMSDTSSKITVLAKDIVYKNKPNIYKTSIKLIDSNGKALTPGVDYDSNVIYSYAESTNVALADGSTKSVQSGTPVSKKDILLPGTIIKATIYGKGKYAGSGSAFITTTYKIVPASISSATVKIAKKAYQNETPVTLTASDITLTLNGTSLVYGKDYVIDASTYTNNINVGQASVILRGINENYGGYKKIKFTITGKRLSF